MAEKEKPMRRARNIDELIENILVTFENPEAAYIAINDYVKIVRFLMDRGLYTVVQGISDRLGGAERNELRWTKAEIVGGMTHAFLTQGNLLEVRRMYVNPALADCVSRYRYDIAPGIENYIRNRCSRAQDVPMYIEDLQHVFPQEEYYFDTLSRAETVLCEELPQGYEPREMIGSGSPEPEPEEAPRETRVVDATPIVKEVSVGIFGTSMTVAGDPVASGWRYKLYRAVDDQGHEYAYRVQSDCNPYRPDPEAGSDTASMLAEEILWFQLSERFPDSFVRILDTADEPVRAQLVELADRSFESPFDMTFDERLDAVIAMLRALQDMHDEGYVHNGVKPGCLLRVDGKWKLAGLDSSFRVGKFIENPHPEPEYMSPEQYGNGNIGCASDVWSAGVMLFQALTDRLPFEGRGEAYRINAMKGLFEPGSLSPQYTEVLERVFSVDTSDRPKAGELADILQGFRGNRL